MKKKYMKFIIMTAVIIVAAIILIVVSKVSGSPKNDNINLKTMKVEYSNKIFINGTVQTVNNKNIYLDQSKGKVDTVSVKDGQEVKVGDVLFSYKNDDIESQIIDANSTLQSANKAKSRAESKVNDAKNELQSLENQGADEDTINQAKSALSDLEDALDQADDNVTDANNKLNLLKNNEITEVKADVNGVVSIIGSQEDYSSPYMKISSGDICIKGTVNEKNVAKLKPLDTAKILVIATEKYITGKVSEVSKEPVTQSAQDISSQSGDTSSSLSNYNVTLTLDNTADLINGYHVQATVQGADSKLEVPESALLDGKYMYKVVNKKLKRVDVTYKNISSKKIAILSGIKDGDEIVTNPSKSTKEGMKVE